MEPVSYKKRVEDLEYMKIRVNGIEEVLRELEDIRRIKHLKNYIKKKKEDCETLVKIYEQNVEYAKGPMHD